MIETAPCEALPMRSYYTYPPVSSPVIADCHLSCTQNQKYKNKSNSLSSSSSTTQKGAIWCNRKWKWVPQLTSSMIGPFSLGILIPSPLLRVRWLGSECSGCGSLPVLITRLSLSMHTTSEVFGPVNRYAIVADGITSRNGTASSMKPRTPNLYPNITDMITPKMGA